MSGERHYAQGGYIAGGQPVEVFIHPDECLIRAADVKAGRIVCSRPGHPTPTSDCSTRIRRAAEESDQ